LLNKPDEAGRREWLESLKEWTWAPFDDAWEASDIALTKAVEARGSACIPFEWKHPETKHPTGRLVNRIRSTGCHLHNKPDEAERRKWLEDLAGWRWDARK